MQSLALAAACPCVLLNSLLSAFFASYHCLTHFQLFRNFLKDFYHSSTFVGIHFLLKTLPSNKWNYRGRKKIRPYAMTGILKLNSYNQLSTSVNIFTVKGNINKQCRLVIGKLIPLQQIATFQILTGIQDLVLSQFKILRNISVFRIFTSDSYFLNDSMILLALCELICSKHIQSI